MFERAVLLFFFSVVRSSSVLLHTLRKILLRKKIKEKRGTKKKTKMLCSSRLLAFFSLSKKNSFLLRPTLPDFPCVALDYTNAKRGASKRLDARLTPAPTKRTRERETHTHTHTHTQRERRTWANASRAPPPKKSSLTHTFTCPFCNHEKSVSANDFQQYKGLVGVVGQKYVQDRRFIGGHRRVFGLVDACERLNAPGVMEKKRKRRRGLCEERELTRERWA